MNIIASIVYRPKGYRRRDEVMPEIKTILRNMKNETKGQDQSPQDKKTIEKERGMDHEQRN